MTKIEISEDCIVFKAEPRILRCVRASYTSAGVLPIRPPCTVR